MRARLAWATMVAATVLLHGSVDLPAAQLTDAKAPRKIKDVKPVYPAKSLLAGDEGAVIVELKVGVSGSVSDARVLWSKCPALNESALKATRVWQFEKLLINGKAKPFVVTTEVPFRLPEKLKTRAGLPGACRWVHPPKPVF